jgi:Fe-S-cluster containining protein
MATNKAKDRGRPRDGSGDDVLADLSGVELDARRRERLETVQLLKSERTPLKLIEVSDRATALAETTIADFKKRHPPPQLACQEGCDWCCYLTVGTAAPEVLRIIEYLRQTLPPEEFQATKERIISADELKKSRKADRVTEPPLPCPLLVNHRCSVYPVRPLTCRGCNSRDPEPCERFLHSRKVVIPMYAPQHRLSAFVLDGLRAGLAEARLNGDLLELTAALRIALDIPQASDRWLAGEPLFTPARLT